MSVPAQRPERAPPDCINNRHGTVPNWDRITRFQKESFHWEVPGQNLKWIVRPITAARFFKSLSVFLPSACPLPKITSSKRRWEAASQSRSFEATTRDSSHLFFIAIQQDDAFYLIAVSLCVLHLDSWAGASFAVVAWSFWQRAFLQPGKIYRKVLLWQRGQGISKASIWIQNKGALFCEYSSITPP